MRAVVLLAAIALVSAGCTGGEDGARAGAGAVTVSAAASLSTAFEAYAARTAVDERFSFAGSDALAAQIRQGAMPDVYAAANADLPRALFEEGEVQRPVVFATNTLVVAVPADSPIDALQDLAEPGVDIVVGAQTVPVGAYTRAVLDRLPARRRAAILANVRSEETDVNAAVGKLTQGAAGASFTYRSDVAAAGGRLRALELADDLQPEVAYAVAVVEGAANPAAGRAFIEGLRSGEGARALRQAGFGPPPGA